VISDTASAYNGWPEMFDSRSSYFWALTSYLGDTGVAEGLSDYADTSATCTSGADCLYQPIGATETYTYTPAGHPARVAPTISAAIPTKRCSIGGMASGWPS